MTGVIMAAVVVGLIGLLIGLLLGFAAKAFAVPVDEKEIEVSSGKQLWWLWICRM